MKKLIAIIFIVALLVSGVAWGLEPHLFHYYYIKKVTGTQAGNNLAFTADRLTFGVDYIIF
jgi:hypothetical protein